MKQVLIEIVAKGAVYGLGTSFNGLAAVILIPFYTRHLQAGEYGSYALAEAILSLLLVALGLGMNVAVLARYPGLGAAARREFFGTTFAFMTLSTMALDALFLAGAWLARPAFLPALKPSALALVGVLAAVETLWLLVATLYRAEGWAWRFIAASGMQVVVGLSSTVLLIVAFGFRDEGILWGRLIGDIAVLLGFVVPTAVRYPLRIDLARARSLLGIGLPMLPATLATMWVLMSPRYFIERYGTVSDVGVYTMSAKVASILSLLFVQPFALTWMVVIFKIFRHRDAKNTYARVITYFVLAGGTLALALGVAAPVLTSVLGQAHFPLSPRVVMVVGLAVVASALMYPLNVGPYVLERTAMQVPAFLGAAALMTALAPPMVRSWGVEGAAWALLAVYLCQGAALFIVSQRMYRIPLERLRLLKALGALVMAYTAATRIGGAGSGRWIEWLRAPAFLVLVALGLVLLRFPDGRERSGLGTLATDWAASMRRRPRQRKQG